MTYTDHLDDICRLARGMGRAIGMIEILLADLEGLNPKGIAVRKDMTRARELVALLRDEGEKSSK